MGGRGRGFPLTGVCSVSAAVMLPLECFVTGERARCSGLPLAADPETQTARLLFLQPYFKPARVACKGGDLPHFPPSGLFMEYFATPTYGRSPSCVKAPKVTPLLQSDVPAGPI